MRRRRAAAGLVYRQRPSHVLARRYAATDPGLPSGGVLISFIVVAILLYTGWRGWEMVYRHRVGVADDPATR